MTRYRKTRAVKGMSLVEIIISMVIFAITALILVQVGTTINNLHKNSIKVDRKVTIEKPYVVNSYYAKDKTGADQKLTCANDNMKVKVEINGHDVDLTGVNYKTKSPGISISADASKTDTVDLQFVQIDLSKVARYKTNTDGYFVLKSADHRTYYKKDGKYYENTGTESAPIYTVVDSDKVKTQKVEGRTVYTITIGTEDVDFNNELAEDNIWRPKT